jgi:hypothetical protein
MANLRNEFYTHLAPQAMFIESSPGRMPLLFSPVYSPTCLLQLQSFFIWSLHGDVHSPTLWCSVPCLPLLQAHWGRWRHTHLLQLAFYLEFAWESAPPPLRWSFPHDNHCFKVSLLQGFWAGAANSCLLWPACLFTVRVRECHSPELREPCPLCYISFFFQLLVYY